MSPRRPVVSGRQVVDALKQAGFEVVRIRGSHCKLRHPNGQIVIVPLHDELAVGTLASVLKQADITMDQLRELL